MFKDVFKKNMAFLMRKTIFKRLVFSFICILVPIYILSMIIYGWGIETLRREIYNSMDAQVTFYLNSLENEVQRILALQYDCVGDLNLNRLAIMPEALDNFGKTQNILRLQQRLNAIKNSSIYIDDAFAMVQSIDRKISALSVSEFDSDLYAALKQNPLQTDTKMVMIDNKMFLSVSYPLQGVDSKRGPIFIIAVALSKEKIIQQLDQMTVNAGEGSMLINFPAKLLIGTNENSSIDDEIVKSIEVQNGIKSGDGKTIYIEKKPYLTAYKVSDYLNLTLCKYVLQESVFAAMQKYQYWFILLMLSALIIIIIYSLYTYRIIHRPLKILTKSFAQVEGGNLKIHIEHNIDDEFRYIYNSFNAMVENLNTLIDQVYKQKILTQKSELKQLQSQINPHFLYNSFFILNTMSRTGDIENLEKFTEQLGKYFQFITRNSSNDIFLENEVAHAKVYAEIQAVRFSNRIEVEFDELPEKYKSFMVPRLILQPIIENAFAYGLELMAEKGILKIGFADVGEGLQIIVQDNGNRFNAEKLEELRGKLNQDGENGEITGMVNIHQRIRLKYGNTSGIQVSQSEQGGLKVVIHIATLNEVSKEM